MIGIQRRRNSRKVTRPMMAVSPPPNKARAAREHVARLVRLAADAGSSDRHVVLAGDFSPKPTDCGEAVVAAGGGEVGNW
jgi:hypothetical protein